MRRARRPLAPGSSSSSSISISPVTSFFAARVVKETPVFIFYLGLVVYDGDLTRLCKALARVFNIGFVYTFLHDLVAYVVRAVCIELLLIRAEAERYGLIMYQYKLGYFQVCFQYRAQCLYFTIYLTHGEKLPKAEVTQVEVVERSVFHQRAAQVQGILYAIGFIFFEVVWKHLLRAHFGFVEMIRYGSVYHAEAVFKIFPALIY